ncbi:MAG TPA: hypothetical protein VGH28_28385 [Polyangiaceae bacterium]|jgi:hypothetical protein
MKLSTSAMLRDDERTAPLPMFPLDLDDDVSTSLDMDAFAPAPGAREESYVGTRPREEEVSVVDAVRARHESLASAVASLEATCAAFDSVDPSAVAAQTSLRRRVGSLAMLVQALEGVAALVETSKHDLFAGDGLLAPYLAGIYLWASDVTETLHALARDLNTLAPDWASFRDRLNDVSWIHEMALIEGRRIEAVIDLIPSEMTEPMDDLLLAFVGLKHKIDEPFG